MGEHKFPYSWTLKDSVFTKDKGTVFSCFACGGGSTMGYKLAGFDVIGCNEIDQRMNNVYVANHHPKFNFLEDIRTFKSRKDLPIELYKLDILDGSPPCSSFSPQGNRGEDWGKKKKFREGQSEQVLDTLFFDFIDLAKELQPKVVIAENVKGLMMGEALDYVVRIYNEFDLAGYYCQHFLLNAQYMGVPQNRERVFFICLRKDLASQFLYQYDLFSQKPFIKMEFNEKPILISEFTDYKGTEITSPTLRELWDNRQNGDKDQSDANMRMFGKPSNFSQRYVYQNEVCWTLTAKEMSIIHFNEPRALSKKEVNCVSTFPQDYDYINESPHYIAGMSVPPVMMAQVASNVYEQWLSKIPKSKTCEQKEIKKEEPCTVISNNPIIKGKVHCFFEQSGTFKNEFIKLGIPAEDYDIQNNFGQTDHIIDLFAEIENAYSGGISVFDNITKDDLIMAFFPCIYFSAISQMSMSFGAKNYRKMSIKEKTDKILERSINREYFFRICVKMISVAMQKNIRLIMENPWSEQTFLKANFVMPPSLVDMDRTKRCDFYKKPTAYWFVNIKPTNGHSYTRPKETKTVLTAKSASQSGLCSEERSLISPDYAKNFICDFILGEIQQNSQLSLF